MIFSCFLLTISLLFLVNKYVMQNFAFISFFSSISILHTKKGIVFVVGKMF